MGMWWQPKADAFDWQFNKGYTQTMKTGPTKDHTSGSGNYLNGSTFVIFKEI